jgi:NAD+ kinase
MGVDPAVAPASFRRVGIVAKHKLRAAAGLLDELGSWLTSRGVEPIYEVQAADLAASGGRHFHTATRDNLLGDVDLIVVLGGDGTLLAMADRIAQARRTIPILGVNFGSLGFLTEVTLPELYPTLDAALAGRARIDRRLMLRCRICRDGATVSDFVVLNDVVVTRGTVSRIIDLTVSVDDQFVARFKADGIILASPTGSTAYNLAAGGPIVYPSVDALVLTPIAPHTLTNRPVVIPASSAVRIQPHRDGAPQEIYATFDGQSGCALEGDDVVNVTRAETVLELVRTVGRSYFEVLRQKLKWAER